MSSDSGQNKTHDPTPRRLEEAQRKGQVAVSSELSAGLVALVGAGMLWFTGRAIWQRMEQMSHYWLMSVSVSDWTIPVTQAAARVILTDILAIVGPTLAVLFVASFLLALLQSGFHVTFEPLQPNWERLSPIKGMSRLFSLRSSIRGAFAGTRAAAVAAASLWIVNKRLNDIVRGYRMSLRDLAGEAWILCMQLAVAVSGCLVLLGLIDYLFQRWKHFQDLRMTLQEVRDEQKQDNGDPHLNARIRQLQREFSQRRMLDDVASASVILTNPTHFAVAIRYDRASNRAPVVVAKGADHLARRIIERAKEHRVPVVERKPLARALYATMEIGQEIPAELYRAIAEVLVYINKMRMAA